MSAPKPRTRATPKTKQPMAEDLLEGITGKTTKSDLMERLQKAAKELGERREAMDNDRETRLREIEERVKKKRSSIKREALRRLYVSDTVEAWKDTKKFLDEFGSDLLPDTLVRVLQGADAIVEEAEKNGKK